MSNANFPTSAQTPGLAWSVIQSPQFNTGIQRAVSGREVRTAYMQYPLWSIKLTYDILRGDAAHRELQMLAGFFCARQGAFDSFLYQNPNDYQASSEAFGTGNGAGNGYQLYRTYGNSGFTISEPVNNANVVSIAFNAITQNAANYSVSSTGFVTFTSNVPNGATMTWNGDYKYRVRFEKDMVDFEEFMYNLWKLQQLSFVGSVVNKV